MHPHPTRVRNAITLWTRGESMSQHPTTAGAHTQKVSKVRMQFARTRCMVTIPKVSPFHCRNICGVALSRIAFTVAQPATVGPAQVCMLLAMTARHEARRNSTHTLATKPRMKSSCLPCLPKPSLTERGDIAIEREPNLDGCRQGFPLKIIAPKTATLAPTDRLKA